MIQEEIARLQAASDPDELQIDLPPGWPDIGGRGSPPPVRAVEQPVDGPIRVVVSPLFVTALQLAPDEQIIDCVIGDAVFFEVQCADNVAYIKGRADARRTRLTISTRFDRLYSFEVFCLEGLSPDQVLRVSWTPAALLDFGSEAVTAPEPEPDLEPQLPPLPPIGEPEPTFTAAAVPITFEPASTIGVIQAQIHSAEEELARLAEEAAQESIRMGLLRDDRLADFLDAYPRRVEPRYRLTEEIRAPPLMVSQIWTDGRFTYLRSHSEESPAIYEITGQAADEELFVNYTLSPGGLYVVDHVMDAGYAQLHGSRGEWHVWDVPPLSVVNQVPQLDLPQLAPDWRRTKSQRSWFVRHKKLTTFIAVTAGIYASVGFLNSGENSKFCFKAFYGC